MLAGCEQRATHPALEGVELPRLVAANEFVFNRHAFGGFSFSPDGSRLAWSGPSGWSVALHVRSEATGKVNVFRVGGSGSHWSADSRRFLILDDKSGAENHHLYRLDVDHADAVPVDLTPDPGARVWLFQILKDDPEHVLILSNKRERTLRDLYRVNLSSGAHELVAQNPGDGVAPVTDATGKFLGWRKAAAASRPRGKERPPELRDRSALSRKSEDVTRAIGVSKDRSEAWVLTNSGRDRTALVHLEAGAHTHEIVYEDAMADVGRVLMSQRHGKPLLVSSVADYPRTLVLDKALEADLQIVLAAYRDVRHGYDIVSMDPVEERMVVTVYTHANRRYHLLDRKRRTQTLLGESRSAEFAASMVVPEAVSIKARDGLSLPAYLLKPAGTSSRPLPTVLLVHGGPWGRVQWSDLDQQEDLLRAQFIANRGYAVLLVNFRGSTGFGRGFMTAAVGEFGAKMQDDLIDAVRWAVDAGIADPQRLAIMGHSYGGYATLMALAQEPKTFACGIDIAGPTDLARLIETFPKYWELELSYWYGYVGDPAVSSDRERMQKVSPINLADRIERPLLVIQGEKDVRVPVEQSRVMVERLRKDGKTVEYVAVEDMGHSTGYWAHHLLVLRETERFLSTCLGGRSARIDLMEWVARLSGRLPVRR